jgi:hypothetical protein
MKPALPPAVHALEPRDEAAAIERCSNEDRTLASTASRYAAALSSRGARQIDRIGLGVLMFRGFHDEFASIRSVLTR